MEKVELSLVIENPGAIKRNTTAQRQLAEWLVRFGVKHGTIKTNGTKVGEIVGTQETRVLRMRQGFDAQELCASNG